MKKIRNFFKIGFYSANIILIIFYLFPGSILGWFLYNKPGGHQFLKNLFSKNLIKNYSEFLKKKKITDTLILTAQK